jgi:hypothetical protein
VSEETPSSEEKAKSIDPEVLRQQAEEIRQASIVPVEEPPKPISRWVQGGYLAILVLVIASVLFLLVSRESRLGLLKGVAHAWTSVSSTEDSVEVFKLPAPPPKTVEPKVVLQGSPTFVFRNGRGYSVPAPDQSDSAETPDAEGDAATEDESKPPAPPEKTAGSKAAFDLLVKNSEVAQKLTSNGFPDLQFKEWQPVKNNPPEFWINVVAVKAGQNVQFVWMVNTESGTVTPLSQNARDLQLRK